MLVRKKNTQYSKYMKCAKLKTKSFLTKSSLRENNFHQL